MKVRGGRGLGAVGLYAQACYASAVETARGSVHDVPSPDSNTRYLQNLQPAKTVRVAVQGTLQQSEQFPARQAATTQSERLSLGLGAPPRQGHTGREAAASGEAAGHSPPRSSKRTRQHGVRRTAYFDPSSSRALRSPLSRRSRTTLFSSAFCSWVLPRTAHAQHGVTVGLERGRVSHSLACRSGLRPHIQRYVATCSTKAGGLVSFALAVAKPLARMPASALEYSTRASPGH